MSAAEDFHATIEMEEGPGEKLQRVETMMTEMKKDLSKLRGALVKAKAAKASNDDLVKQAGELTELSNVVTIHKTGFNKTKAAFAIID